MSRGPKITPENYTEVYDHYREAQAKPLLNTLVHMAGKALYSPDIVMSDTTHEALLRQLILGKGALIASNHPSGHDVFALPGALRTTGIPELQETGALAKDSLFHQPLRLLSDATGSVPVFREKSYPGLDRGLFLSAANAALDVMVARLKQGRAVVIMPEGTNSTVEARTHLSPKDIKAGIARVAFKAGDSDSFILPVGIRYRSDPSSVLLPRHPVVAIGQPITDYESTALGIKTQIHIGMQRALDQAGQYIDETS